MKYMMLVCWDDDVILNDEEEAAMGKDTLAWVQEMDARGVRLDGHRIRPVSDATLVRVRDGETMLSDGPFAESKEQIAGYDIIECADLDEALAVAAAHPVSRYGVIEVRPFHAD